LTYFCFILQNIRKLKAENSSKPFLQEFYPLLSNFLRSSPHEEYRSPKDLFTVVTTQTDANPLANLRREELDLKGKSMRIKVSLDTPGLANRVLGEYWKDAPFVYSHATEHNATRMEK